MTLVLSWPIFAVEMKKPKLVMSVSKESPLRGGLTLDMKGSTG